jgi:Mannosyl-glycoprotein endo-beta-N-acetylglucosaminidase
MGRTRRWAVGLAMAGLCGVFAAATPADAAAITGYVHVNAGATLSVRTGPSTTFTVVRRAPNGAPLRVACQAMGLWIAGSVRNTAVWDRLIDGRYVSDAYVYWPGRRPAIGWCAVAATVRVAGVLNMRPTASTLHQPVGVLRANTGIAVMCQLGGENVAGSARTTPLWDRLTNGWFVTDAYIAWPGSRPALPWCISSSGTAPPAGNAFVTWASGYARATMASYRVPASVTIAQAILESGWGRSGLTLDGNSFFGMKCFGSPGMIALGCRPYRTTECATSGCYITSASFRVYASIWASFRDHAYQLATLPRYRNAFRYVTNPDRFAIEIHRAGYATSPSYARNLIALMRRYNLYRFDASVLRP